MEHAGKTVRKIYETCVAFGGACLVAIMVLLVVNILLRLCGGVVPGVIELTELLIIGAVGFALAYTALEKAHVVVRFVVERLPSRVQMAFETFAYALSACIWGVITWLSIDFMIGRGFTEQSELLGIPFFPFRVIWVCGLTLLTLALLGNSIQALIRMRGRDK